MSDIAFIVDNEETKKEERIACHRLILATRSRVFSKLFNGPNAEKSLEIKINDVKAKDFKNMLRYVYYDDTSGVDVQSFCSTFVAAEKYALRTLTKALVEKIKYFDGDDTCIMLKQLENCKINNKEFQREVAKKYQIETKKIIDSSEFVHLNTETLKDLASCPILNVREIELFNAILKWARSQSVLHNLSINSVNLKKFVTRLIYLFRYKSMNLKEFSSGAGLLKFLTDSESVDLFLYLSLAKSSNVQLPKQLIQNERQFPTVYDVQFIDNETTQAVEKPKERTFEYVEFKTDSELYLKGVVVGESNYVGCLRALRANILIAKSNSVEKHPISSQEFLNQASLKCHNPSGEDADKTLKSVNFVEFDYPVLIESNVDYILSMNYHKTSGPYSFKSYHSKRSSANVLFEFKAEHGLCFMNKLVFNKFE